MGKMKALVLDADWQPEANYLGGSRDIEGKQATVGSKVWKNPLLKIKELPIPEPGAGEVLLKVKACGICGSDIHMAHIQENGYIPYPGLTSFPIILGHEISGVVVKSGSNAIDRKTGLPFKEGEIVCAEEMQWCGKCSSCVIGEPNYCENLNEMGFNKNGGFAEYVVIPDKSIWSLEPLKDRFSEKDIFLAGSLIEPAAVAYNAIFTLAGAIYPGQIVIVNGGGPIGLSACALAKRSGASIVILIEPSESRRTIGKKIGADFSLDNTNVDLQSEILRITNGKGAHLYIESSGYTSDFWNTVEKCIWRGTTIGSKVCIISRSDEQVSISPDVLQVKKASIFGSYGHAGHNNFYYVIESVAMGLNLLPMITKTICLEETPNILKSLQFDKTDCKVTVLME